MANRPKVSIVSIAYNQEKYIGQALQSFVDQDTTFPFEVVVADDASSDKTSEIIQGFANKYPEIIKPVLRKSNIGALKNFYDALSSAQGEYIALCEGDDYWINSHKIQRQVNFLDANKDYALCFHPVKVIFENNEEKPFTAPANLSPKNLTTNELLKTNYIYTNSVMYRRQQYKHLPLEIMPGDWFLHLYHAQFGKIGFIDEVMSVYRRHEGGLWWDSYKNVDALWRKHGIAHLRTYVELLKIYKKEEDKVIIQALIENALKIFIKVDELGNLLSSAVKEYPEVVVPFIVSQQTTIQNLTQDTIRQRLEISQMKTDLSNVKEELTIIKSSKTWKIHNKLREFYAGVNDKTKQ